MISQKIITKANQRDHPLNTVISLTKIKRDRSHLINKVHTEEVKIHKTNNYFQTDTLMNKSLKIKTLLISQLILMQLHSMLTIIIKIHSIMINPEVAISYHSVKFPREYLKQIYKLNQV